MSPFSAPWQQHAASLVERWQRGVREGAQSCLVVPRVAVAMVVDYDGRGRELIVTAWVINAEPEGGAVGTACCEPSRGREMEDGHVVTYVLLYYGKTCPWTHFIVAESLVLVGGAIQY